MHRKFIWRYQFSRSQKYKTTTIFFLRPEKSHTHQLHHCKPVKVQRSKSNYARFKLMLTGAHFVRITISKRYGWKMWSVAIFDVDIYLNCDMLTRAFASSDIFRIRQPFQLWRCGLLLIRQCIDRGPRIEKWATICSSKIEVPYKPLSDWNQWSWNFYNLKFIFFWLIGFLTFQWLAICKFYIFIGCMWTFATQKWPIGQCNQSKWWDLLWVTRDRDIAIIMQFDFLMINVLADRHCH